MRDEDLVFRALADPTRRLILDELAQRDEQTRYEICVRLVMKHHVRMTPQAIGKHIEVLRKAGLVKAERRGKYRVLTLDAEPIRQVSERWMRRIVQGDEK